MAFALPAAATAVAAAAPAAAAKATLMATLKSVAFKAITNLAISAAMSALQPQVGGQGGRTFEWTIDPDAPIPFAAGRVGVAGSVVHRDTFGPDLMYYGIPAVLSGAGPITGYDSVQADDYTVTFDATGKAITSTYAGELWFKSTLGNQPDVALSSPTGLKNGAALPGWTSQHKLSGKAAYMVVMGENSKGSAFPTGEIKPLITFRGLKGWDPRQDSTYPGGSGACRLDNPATWVYLTNPILWALKWSLGLWEGPTGKGAPQVDHQVGGIGAKLSGIDVPAFVAAANIADANGWTVSGYPNTDDDKHQVLAAFLQSGGAIYSQRAGKISCIQRAAPRTSIVTISAADTAGPLEIDTAASRIDRINTIRPRFWSPAHRWQMTAMDEVTAASYQNEDGGKRTRGIDYPFVSNAKQAGQLAALQIANTREGIAGVIPLKPHLQRIRPGDAFTITEPGFVLNGLKCLCLNTDYDPATGVVRVSFVSETDQKYPFALGQDPTPPEPQVLTPVDPGYVSPPLPEDWVIVPRPPGTGGQVPGFDLSGQVGNDTATAIQVDWWEVPAGVDPNDLPPADADWQSAGTHPPTATIIPIDVQPDRYYWIGLTYIRNQNYSERVPSGPWLSGKLISDDVDPNAPGLDQIKADIEAAFGDIFDVSELIGDTRADLEAADAALGSAIGSLDSRADTLETQTASLDANKASVSSLNAQITRIDDVVAVNASQALALVDLETGKVALSEYNTLKGEVTAARDGSSSLLGQIQNLKSVDLDLQNNKASVESVNALTARTTNTEADIIDLELAQAGETSARVEAINELAARSAHRPNLIDNPSGDADFRSWIKEGGPNSSVLDDNLAGRIFVVTDYMVSRVYPSAAGDQHSLSYNASPVGGGGVRLQYLTSGGTIEGVNVPNTLGSIDERRRSSAPSTAPAGTTGFRLVVAPPAGASLPVWAIKVNFGAVATEFSDDYSATVLEASVTEQSLAIIDLENQQAIASWYKTADASGGKPVRLGLTSSSFGSFIALEAPFIYWGDNTVFDDATDTLQTTIGGFRRVLAFGAPFGASGNLLDWWGPSSVALGSMTTGNGLNGRMTTAPYVFDNAVSGTRRALVNAPDTSVGSSWVLMAQYTMGGVSAGPDGIIVAARFDVTTFLFLPSGGGVTDFYGEMQLREMAPDGSGSTVLSTKAFNSTTGDPSTSTTAAGSRTGEVRYQVWMRSTQPAETATIGGKVEFQAAPNG